eukprot:1169730-Prorocentrum_minimum.AAC.1
MPLKKLYGPFAPFDMECEHIPTVVDGRERVRLRAERNFLKHACILLMFRVLDDRDEPVSITLRSRVPNPPCSHPNHAHMRHDRSTDKATTSMMDMNV